MLLLNASATQTRRRRYATAVVALLTVPATVLYFKSSLIPSRNSLGSDFIYRGPDAEDKAIVMARMEYEDVSWVSEELPDWQHAIYTMDDPEAELHPPSNTGREAMAYLTYLIDHYHILPNISVFLHPHRQGWPKAWHTDAKGYDNVISVQSLRLEYVHQHGYANMRCIGNPGCPVEVRPSLNGTEEAESVSKAFHQAYKFMFQVEDADVPEAVGTPCCSQFAVSREQIRKRPLQDYQRYRQWILDAGLTSDITGRVFEYLWHVIFGKGPVWCPQLEQCWCQQFGRC